MIESTINSFFDSLAEKTANYVEPRYLSENSKDSLSLEIIKYKLNIYYRSFANYLILFFLSLLFHIPITNVIFFVIFYILISRYTHGFHFSHSVYCIPMSMFTCISSLLLSQQMNFTVLQRTIMLVALFAIYLLFAPCETKRKPIPKRHRKELKIKSLITFIFLALISQFLYSFDESVVYGNFIIFALLYRGIYILPFTKINEYFTKRGVRLWKRKRQKR